LSFDSKPCHTSIKKYTDVTTHNKEGRWQTLAETEADPEIETAQKNYADATHCCVVQPATARFLLPVLVALGEDVRWWR